MVGQDPGTDVHWGLCGSASCSPFRALCPADAHDLPGFAARVTGRQFPPPRSAQGLPVGKLIRRLRDASRAGLRGAAGYFEVAASQGRAQTASVGVPATALPAFSVRSSPATNPLVIVPIAILFGGLVRRAGLIQRAYELPDATVWVVQGLIFRRAAGSENALRPLCLFSSRPREETGP